MFSWIFFAQVKPADPAASAARTPPTPPKATPKEAPPSSTPPKATPKEAPPSSTPSKTTPKTGAPLPEAPSTSNWWKGLPGHEETCRERRRRHQVERRQGKPDYEEIEPILPTTVWAQQYSQTRVLTNDERAIHESLIEHGYEIDPCEYQSTDLVAFIWSISRSIRKLI